MSLAWYLRIHSWVLFSNLSFYSLACQFEPFQRCAVEVCSILFIDKIFNIISNSLFFKNSKRVYSWGNPLQQRRQAGRKGKKILCETLQVQTFSSFFFEMVNAKTIFIFYLLNSVKALKPKIFIKFNTNCFYSSNQQKLSKFKTIKLCTHKKAHEKYREILYNYVICATKKKKSLNIFW